MSRLSLVILLHKQHKGKLAQKKCTKCAISHCVALYLLNIIFPCTFLQIVHICATLFCFSAEIAHQKGQHWRSIYISNLELYTFSIAVKLRDFQYVIIGNPIFGTEGRYKLIPRSGILSIDAPKAFDSLSVKLLNICSLLFL